MHTILDAFKSMFGKEKRSPYFTGVLEDTRSTEEKARDYLHEERLASAIADDPFGNLRIVQSMYPYENQKATSSCVPHAILLALGIERGVDVGRFVRLSSMFLYRLRSNFSGEGCVIPDIFLKAKKIGSCLATTLPDRDTEGQANAVMLTPQMYLEAEVYRGLEFYTLKNPRDINEIAAIAQRGHGVPITIYANYDEWARQYVHVEYPDLVKGGPNADVDHEVCVLPRSGFIKDGKKYVTVQDSAWFGGYRLRHVPEEFIAKRTTTAGYWDTVSILGGGPRPKHVFYKSLHFGDRNEDVRKMQLLFISLGLLPSDCATGLFAGRTLAGLHAFQDMYAEDILLPLGLDTPTETFGLRSMIKANELCA